MSLEKRIDSLSAWGSAIEALITNADTETTERIYRKASAVNPWFTKQNILLALSGIRAMLHKDLLLEWADKYPELKKSETEKTVGAVLAGNIPLVGFHDLLCSLMAGFRFKGKLSSKDPILLPYLLELLKEIDVDLYRRAELTDSLLHDFDVVIATGSNNTSRYFDQYFGKYPNIIRKNRTSVAVLTGDETSNDFELLADDIFSYFGLGCRSVSKLFVPQGFAPEALYRAAEKYNSVAQHNKYVNNYEYNRALYLMNNISHFDNGFCIVTANDSFGSPIGVVYFQEYASLASVADLLEKNADNLQCIASSEQGFYKPSIPLGKTQQPGLTDYADDVDTIQFLLNYQ